MGKTKAFSVEEKVMIEKVYTVFKQEKKELQKLVSSGKVTLKEIPIQFNRVDKRVADALNISERSVHKIVNSPFPIQSPPRYENSGEKKITLDAFEEGVVRRAVLEAYSNKIVPTYEYLHRVLREYDHFPKMSRSTLHNICRRQLKFKYGKFEGRPVPMDRPDIAAHRARYLRQIKKFRQDGYNIFFQDESWVNENMGVTKGRHIPEAEVVGTGSFNTHSEPWLRGIGHRFQEALLGGFSAKPTGAGKRIILINIGSEDGFLPGVGKEFIGKRDSSDYHNEMNSEHFNEWFGEVLESIPNRSVIVLDQASYHKAVTPETKNPTTKFRKAELIQWLEEQGVAVPSGEESFWAMTVVELRELAKTHRLEPLLVVEQMIANENTKGRDLHVLFLPVAHCELNPIELMWAVIKGTVRKRNTTFKIADLLPLVKEVIRSEEIDQLWSCCCRHVVELEDWIIKKEKLAEKFIEKMPIPIVISVGEASDESDSEADAYSSTDE